jgi:DNA-binding Lrp family transcriptional regulator
MDALDRKILALLVEDGRRTYDDIARRVSLSAPSVKRRVDRLREQGALERFTVVVDHGALGWNTEALVERLIMDLQRYGLVVRTRSQVVLSRLVSRAAEGL